MKSSLVLSHEQGLVCVNIKNVDHRVIESIQSVVSSDKANPLINSISAKVAEVIPLRQSAKHMSGRDLGKLGPSESLKYQKSA